MSNNFTGLLLNSFSDIVLELQKYYITLILWFYSKKERKWEVFHCFEMVWCRKDAINAELLKNLVH